MSGKIAGVSKRHFRRLVAKELAKMTKNDAEEEISKPPSNMEEVYLVDHQMPDMALVKEPISSEDEEQNSLEDDLSDWVVENGISLIACDRLLKILSKHGIRVTKNPKTQNSSENPNMSEGVLEMKNVIKSMQQELATVNDAVERLNTKIVKHEVILGRISKTAFPNYRNFEIFPIDSLQQLNEVEKKLPSLDRTELFAYIKRELGSKKLAKSFSKIFTKNLILDVNWNGVKGKTSIKDFKLFNTYIYESLKSDELDYDKYVSDMKLGFKLAKARLYKDKYNSKNLTF